MARNFILPHEQIMHILATAVLTAHPDLDPDRTHFELVMHRVKGGKGEAMLLIREDDPGVKIPVEVKRRWWDIIFPKPVVIR